MGEANTNTNTDTGNGEYGASIVRLPFDSEHVQASDSEQIRTRLEEVEELFEVVRSTDWHVRKVEVVTDPRRYGYHGESIPDTLLAVMMNKSVSVSDGPGLIKNSHYKMKTFFTEPNRYDNEVTDGQIPRVPRWDASGWEWLDVVATYPNTWFNHMGEKVNGSIVFLALDKDGYDAGGDE